jgi:hypothetical protein
MTQLGSKLPFREAAEEVWYSCHIRIGEAAHKRITHRHGAAAAAVASAISNVRPWPSCTGGDWRMPRRWWRSMMGQSGFRALWTTIVLERCASSTLPTRRATSPRRVKLPGGKRARRLSAGSPPPATGSSTRRRRKRWPIYAFCSRGRQARNRRPSSTAPSITCSAVCRCSTMPTSAGVVIPSALAVSRVAIRSWSSAA